MSEASRADPAIITVAMTGAVPRKEDNPAVPITPAEQIESTHEAFEAGATIAHIHVRNPDQSSASDPERFREVQEGIVRHCPGMIVQFSTGGRGRSMEERASALPLRPDMASLATGSCNFPTAVYDNPPDFIRHLARQMLEYDIKPEIEVFDLAMLYNAKSLLDEGLLKAPLHVQFVLGVRHALPFRESILDFLVAELGTLMPDATWVAAGIGRHQAEVQLGSLRRGGHVRTGLEDNLKAAKDRLAASNAELVRLAAERCTAEGRPVATAEQARKALGLPAVS